MNKAEYIKQLEALEEAAVQNRDNSTPEHYDYFNGLADAYKGAIYWASKLGCK